MDKISEIEARFRKELGARKAVYEKHKRAVNVIDCVGNALRLLLAWHCSVLVQQCRLALRWQASLLFLALVQLPDVSSAVE